MSREWTRIDANKEGGLDSRSFAFIRGSLFPA